MFTALLLPIFAAGSPVVGTRVEQTDDPTVQVWISNDRRFFQSDRATVHIRTREDGYVVVLHADPDGYLRVLAPVDPNEDNFVRGGKKYEVKGRGGREAFTVEVSSGRGTVYAAYSQAPFHFDGYIVGDHWDYRALAPNRLPANPETELTDIVRSMAGGSFDYDVLTYDVLGQAYADNSYSGSSYGYYDNTWCCSGFSIGLSFGTPFYPYAPYYYRPYYYGYYPAYSPFFYYPFYYPSAYYPYYSHYSYRPYYGYYRPYYGHNYWGNNGNYGYGPYTPYRFRGSTAIAGNYGGSPYTFRRTVNTAYGPAADVSNRRQVTRGGAPSVAERGQPSVNRRGVDGRRSSESGARQRTEAPMPVQVGPGARRSSDGAPNARRQSETPMPVQVGPGARRSIDRAPGRTAVAVQDQPSASRREVVARRSRGSDARQSETPMPAQVGPGARRSLDRESMGSNLPVEIRARPAREPEPRAYGGGGGGRSLDRGNSGNSGGDGGYRAAGGGDGGRRSAGGGSMGGGGYSGGGYSGGGYSGGGYSGGGGGYRGGYGGGGGGGGMRRR